LGAGGYIINESKTEFVGIDYQPKVTNIILMDGQETMEAYFKKEIGIRQ
jgi:hypothetical protein